MGVVLYHHSNQCSIIIITIIHFYQYTSVNPFYPLLTVMTAVLPPQTSDNRTVDHLISEYDHVIQQLNQQINEYKCESNELSRQVTSVTEENSRLHNELQSIMETQLKNNVTKSDNVEMDLLIKERESYIDLWRHASEELGNVQKSEMERSAELVKCKSDLLSSKKAVKAAHNSIEHLQSKCDQLETERQKCLQAAQKLDREVNSLQDELRESHHQLKTSDLKNDELKSSLEEAAKKLSKKTIALQAVNEHDESLDHRLYSLRTTNAELEARLSAIQHEVSTLRESRPDMEAEISCLQEKIKILEKREQAAVDHVKESVELVETALLEKEKCELREQQYLQEIKHLKKTVTVLVEEAGAKTKSELEKVREEYNRNIDKMAGEIQQLEQECGQKQSQLERVQREMKELEKELQKVASQCPQEQSWVKGTLNDLRSKLFSAERSRDELATKVKSLDVANNTLNARFVQENKQNIELVEQLQLERKRNQTEVQELRQEIESLTQQCKELQELVATFKQSAKDIEKQSERKISILCEQSQLREKELLSKAKCAQEAHSKITIELRELVTAQQTMSSRWREESRTITTKFEKSVTDLNLKVNEEKRKNKELITKCNRQKHKCDKLVQKHAEMESELAQAYDKLKEAESKVEHTSNQLALLLVREKKMMKEKRDAQRQLDHAKVQIARNLSLMDSQAGTSGIQFSKSFREPYNTSSVFLPKQVSFGGSTLKTKELHSTPRVSSQRHKFTSSDLPVNLTGEDLYSSISSTSTVLASQ